MTRGFVRAIALSMLVLGFASAAFADEMIDNPMYKQWAKYKPGTFVTMKSTSEMAGTKTESTVTTTLKSVTPEKIVVTMEVVSKMGDQEYKMPAQEMEYPAKIKKEDMDDVQKAKDKPDTKKGKETVEVAGKKLATNWTEVKIDNEKMTTVTKMWESEEVPGGLVKMETDMKKPMAGKVKMIVVKFEVKK